MGWFYVITEEMQQLGLKGNELLVFAVLHGFSQRGDGCYYGSKPRLAEICGVSKRTLDGILAALQEKDLIGSKPVLVGERTATAYFTTCRNCTPVQNLHPSPVQNLHPTRAEIAPNNNIDNNTSISIEIEGSKHIAHARAFVAPTLEEVKNYCREKGYYIDPEEFMEHYTSNGWMVGKVHMKDWKATINTWERRRRQGTTPAAPSKQKGNYVLDAMKGLDQLQGTNYYEQYMAAKNGITFPKIDIDEQ